MPPEWFVAEIWSHMWKLLLHHRLRLRRRIYLLTRASRAHAAVTQGSALSGTCGWSPHPRSSLLCSRTWRTSSKKRRSGPHTSVCLQHAVFLSDRGARYEQRVQPMDRPTPPSCWWVARSMLGCHKRPTQSLHIPPEWFVAEILSHFEIASPPPTATAPANLPAHESQ
jgi:hypothetical protein